ncbi:MAG: plasmid mobilization protein [Blautia caecimuris]
MRKRNYTVTIRMNKEEYNLLQSKVKESVRTQQEVVIKAIADLKIASTEEVEELKRLNQLFADILSQLRGATTNINQIARKLHTDGETLYVYLSEYQSGKRISHKKVLELSYQNMKSAKNGLIVITPDFDNFTTKLIAADEYSKYMTETPILEGVANREYYGRSATSIENKSTIEYGTEQGLAALIYGEQGVSSLPIQDIRGEYIDTDNEYMYYYSVEFIK